LFHKPVSGGGPAEGGPFKESFMKHALEEFL